MTKINMKFTAALLSLFTAAVLAGCGAPEDKAQTAGVQETAAASESETSAASSATETQASETTEETEKTDEPDDKNSSKE